MDLFRFVATHVATRAAHWRPSLTSRALDAQVTDAGDGERGQGLAEYALILALIAIIAIVSLALLGGAISGLYFAPIGEDFQKVLDGFLK